MAPTTLHLRSETKPLEHRSALSPTVVRKLVESGFRILVERSPERIFEDEALTEAGAELVEEGSWPNAPADHLIIGLKELEDKDPFPLKHTHIQFSHCYKGQGGWQEVLGRFPRGGGLLYDLEFLEEEVSPGRKARVAAFGYHAGYAGAALALMDWAWQLEHGKAPLPGKSHYAIQDDLDRELRESVAQGMQKNGGKAPRVLVMGAKGRCGRGSVACLKNAGVPEKDLILWDLEETKDTVGPYPEIREADIFINDIYLSAKIPPFVSVEFLKQGKRNLSVVCDVSADTTNPNNPIPFADTPTYFNKPTTTLSEFSDPPLSVIAIDHLPSLLPREASEAFSEALLPSLLKLPERDTAPVWTDAKKLFDQKVSELPDSLRQREQDVTIV